MTILSSQKLKNAKYRFWLQKGVKNSIRQDFLIRDPQLVGSFICYFCLKMTRTSITFGGDPPENPTSGLKSVTFKRNRLVRITFVTKLPFLVCCNRQNHNHNYPDQVNMIQQEKLKAEHFKYLEKIFSIFLLVQLQYLIFLRCNSMKYPILVTLLISKKNEKVTLASICLRVPKAKIVHRY